LEADPGAIQESGFAFECFLRSGHPFGGQHGTKNGVPRSVGQRASLPMRNLSSSNLPETDVRRNSQADRIGHLLFGMAKKFRRHYGSRDDAVGRLVPTASRLFRSGVDESAKYLVTQNRSEDCVFAAAVSRVHDGQHQSKQIAWMTGGRTSVGIIKIEIADHHTVGESGEVRGSFSPANQNGGRDSRSDL